MPSLSMSDLFEWVKKMIFRRPPRNPPARPPRVPESGHLQRDLNLIPKAERPDWRNLER